MMNRPIVSLTERAESNDQDLPNFVINWVPINPEQTTICIPNVPLTKVDELKQFIVAVAYKSAAQPEPHNTHGYQRHGKHYLSAISMFRDPKYANAASFILAPERYYRLDFPFSLWVYGGKDFFNTELSFAYINYLRCVFNGKSPTMIDLQDWAKYPTSLVQTLYLLGGNGDIDQIEKVLRSIGVSNSKSAIKQLRTLQTPPIADFFDPLWYSKNMLRLFEQPIIKGAVCRSPRILIHGVDVYEARNAKQEIFLESEQMAREAGTVELSPAIGTAFVDYIVQLKTGEQLRFNEQAGYNSFANLATLNRLRLLQLATSGK